MSGSTVKDGVKLGCGMFIILPILILIGIAMLFAMCTAIMTTAPGM